MSDQPRTMSDITATVYDHRTAAEHQRAEAERARAANLPSATRLQSQADNSGVSDSGQPPQKLTTDLSADATGTSDAGPPPTPPESATDDSEAPADENCPICHGTGEVNLLDGSTHGCPRWIELESDGGATWRVAVMEANREVRHALLERNTCAEQVKEAREALKHAQFEYEQAVTALQRVIDDKGQMTMTFTPEPEPEQEPEQDDRALPPDVDEDGEDGGEDDAEAAGHD